MITVPLSRPVEHDGKTYAELTFREATIADVEVAAKFDNEFSQTIATLSAISDTPLPAFRKIAARDLKAIMAAAKDLLGND